MASITLYPPVVDSYMPAFQASSEKCVVYFRLSKFNSSIDFKTVHATVIKQDTGTSVVKKTDSDSSIASSNSPIASSNKVNYTRYRSTGVILNIQPIKAAEEDDLYYIEIYNSDLSPAWTAGWTYKIQLRLSAIDCPENLKTSQAQWMKDNAGSFSEWSTVCVVKATGRIDYEIPFLGISTKKDKDLNKKFEERNIEITTLDLVGNFDRKDKTELVHSYRFILYANDNDTVIEDSGELYCDQYQDVDSFKYLFKTELQNKASYYLSFQFETNNKYIGGHYEPEDRYIFTCLTSKTEQPPCIVITAESDSHGYFINPPEHYHKQEDSGDSPGGMPPAKEKDYSKRAAIQKENDEARLGVKLYSDSDKTHTGNLCIRRTDSRSNFKRWEDVFIYVCIGEQKINDIPIFYDYTIESGVFYKYGVQVISTGGIRGDLVEQPILAIREFEYSLLLGKDKKQLNFKFNNEMGNFKYQLYDSKIDPIGSKYPKIARNANTYYRTFPLNGLISFNMDNEITFANRLDVIGVGDDTRQDLMISKNMDELYYQYKYDGTHDTYTDYYGQEDSKTGDLVHKDHYPNKYDYTYEKNFRDLVLEFLQDGEVKLFKSPTEGNILVRLMDVNCTPVQTTNRLIYSFTSTAYEIDECSIDNYKKYGLWTIDDWAEEFSKIETKLGQISTEIVLSKDNSQNILNSNNITDLIKQKYDSSGHAMGNQKNEVINYHHIKITFEGKPLKIKNQNSPDKEYLLGNNISFKGNPITVFAPNRIYEFDDLIKCGMAEEFTVLGDAEGVVQKIPITVDFLYDVKQSNYEDKIIKESKTYRGVGQVFQEYTPGESIMTEPYLKYKLEIGDKFSRLRAFESIDIEANQGAVFRVQDNSDGKSNSYDDHVVGVTERLSFIDISNINSIYYLGMQDPSTGEIIQKNADVLMNYVYLVQKGTYKT